MRFFNFRYYSVYQFSLIIFLSNFLFSCNYTNRKGLVSTNAKEGFVYIQQAIPDILYEIRYANTHNFIGRPIEGYKRATAMLSIPAADSLKKVQDYLKEKGYRLKIFDAYRPQRAVDHFIRWAKVTQDTLMKKEFYPQVDKRNLFKLGYIAEKSGHTRGSTVDLTIVDTLTEKEIDMGSPFDFFGETSHHNNSTINAKQQANRLILKEAMLRFGFKAIQTEWWHYTLINEPYPEKYFNFEVK